MDSVPEEQARPIKFTAQPDRPSPTVGRIVHYVLTEEDASAVNRRRVGGAGHYDGWPEGAQAHAGNPAIARQVVPAIVVWPHRNDALTLNGQAFLDGNDTLWLTSVPYDPDGKPGTWHWPPIEVTH